MSRPRTVDPAEVVAAARRQERQAAIARRFGISRVYVNQIIAEYAPELRTRAKTPEMSPEKKAALDKERKEMIRFLNAHDTRKQAADALGLSTSGLYSRLRRLKIDY